MGTHFDSMIAWSLGGAGPRSASASDTSLLRSASLRRLASCVVNAIAVKERRRLDSEVGLVQGLCVCVYVCVKSKGKG